MRILARLLRFLRYWKAAGTRTDKAGKDVTLHYVAHSG